MSNNDEIIDLLAELESDINSATKADPSSKQVEDIIEEIPVMPVEISFEESDNSEDVNNVEEKVLKATEDNLAIGFFEDAQKFSTTSQEEVEEELFDIDIEEEQHINRIVLDAAWFDPDAIRQWFAIYVRKNDGKALGEDRIRFGNHHYSFDEFSGKCFEDAHQAIQELKQAPQQTVEAFLHVVCRQWYRASIQKRSEEYLGKQHDTPNNSVNKQSTSIRSYFPVILISMSIMALVGIIGFFMFLEKPSSSVTTGKIEIATEQPVSNLEILLDGVVVGVALPLTLEAVSPGPHRMIIKAVGYQVGRFDLEVIPGETSSLRYKPREVPPEPIMSEEEIQLSDEKPTEDKQIILTVVEINSRPQGANVFIDDQLKGKTPLELPEMIIGKQYHVKLQRRGFKAHSEVVQVEVDHKLFYKLRRIKNRRGKTK